MDHLKLTQRKLFKVKYFELRDDSIDIEESILFNTKKFIINYEDITANSIETVVSSKIKYWVMIVLFIVCLFTLYNSITTPKSFEAFFFFAAIFLAVTASYFFTREKVVVFESAPDNIVLFPNKPNVKEVNSFCDSLIKNRKDYLVNYYHENYTESTKVIELAKLNQLKETGVITDKEFIKLKNEIINGRASDNNFSSN
ncbi:MAG: hypothetical protein HND52_02570 [Ignavibacteriae bacterium]|nr:hypothetical protein [Ignavibacteriota bacterium]NOG96834.1 hypothetical protein [Ignavibacteriota bacterium]